MCVDMLNQAVCILTHFKEICLFLRRLYFSSTVRAFAVYQLGFCPERFARRAVHSLIVTLIDITLVIQLLENLLYLFLVVCICSTDKIIIRGVHHIPDFFYLSCNLIYIFLRCDACLLCLLLNLLSVLIRSGLEVYVIPFPSAESCNRICQYDFIGVSNMRLTGSVSDGSCHIKFPFVTHVVCSFQN